MGQLRRYRGLAVVVVTGVAVLALLWMLAVPSGTEVAERPLSAFEAGPRGLRALYLLGKRTSLNIRLGTTSLDLLTGVGTIVIGPEGRATSAQQLDFDERDVWKLLDRGMDVLFLAPIRRPSLPQAETPTVPPEPESPVETEFGESVSSPEQPAAQPLSQGERAKTVSKQVPYELDENGSARFHVGDIDSPFFAGARTLEVSGIDLSRKSRWQLWKRLAGSAQEVYWLGDSNRPFLAVYQGSRGKLVALFVSEILTNENVGRADNVMLGYNLLREADSPLGTYFLESIHGHYRASVGLTNLLVFTPWGRLIILAAIAVLISLMPQVFPLGRKRVRRREQFPSPIERVHAQAQLWRQARMFVPAMHFALGCALTAEAGAEGAIRSFGRALAAAGIDRRRIQELDQVMHGRLKPDGAARGDLIHAYGIALRQRGYLQPHI